jgi:hypothetical protein
MHRLRRFFGGTGKNFSNSKRVGIGISVFLLHLSEAEESGGKIGKSTSTTTVS